MKRKVPIILLCLIFAGIAVFSGYKIIMILSEYKAGEETYADLQQYISMPEATEGKDNVNVNAVPGQTADRQQAETEVSIPTAGEGEKGFPTVDFETLCAINSDVVGWLYLQGTQINFPVVQGEDNQEYLYWLINGDYNSAGTPFMDYRNTVDFSDRNTIIYGHNMNNGTMFADIHKYTEQQYYDEHPFLLLLTPEGNHKVEIFAGYITGLDANAWQMDFSSDEEFTAWIETAIGRSAFKSNVVPMAEDKILTLSTCSSSANQTRFVLLGIIR